MFLPMTTEPHGHGHHPVRVVPKPWGHETIWAHGAEYVGKILHIKAGHELSLQYHNMKDETIYLLSGEMTYLVEIDGASRIAFETGVEQRRRIR